MRRIKMITAMFVALMVGIALADRTISSDYTLVTDEDWTDDGLVSIANGVKVDLAGHNLAVAGFNAPTPYCITNAEGVVAGYQDLEFIDVSGGQYVITGYKPSCTDKAEMRFMFNANGFSANQFLWCDRTASGGKDRFSCGKVDGKFRFDRYNGNFTPAVSIIPAASSGLDYTVTADYGTGNIAVNGVWVGGVMSNFATEYTPPTNIMLFASFEIAKSQITYLNNYAKIRFYSFKVYDRDGNLKCHIVPALRKESGAIGVYDRVAGTFHENIGNGAFTAYAESESRTEITNSADGDPAELRIIVRGSSQELGEMIDYIQPTGSQYIITDYVPESTDRMEMKIVPTIANNNQFFFCTRTSGGSAGQFGLASLPAKLRFDFGTMQSSNGKTLAAGSDTEYVIVADGATGTVSIDGETVASVTPPETAFTAPTNLVLFASFQISNGAMVGWNNYAKCKCYYFKAYSSDGTLKLDLVPAQSLTSVCGMYDRVRGKFYESASTTPFPAYGTATDMSKIENRSIAFTGNLRLVKDGEGTFTAAKSGQTYYGGTVVTAGTLVFGTDGRDCPFGPAGSTITVSTNATGIGVLDMNGTLFHNSYLFEMNGGMLKNSKPTSPDSYSSEALSNMVLTADSIVQTDQPYGFTSVNEQGNVGLTGTFIDLGGHKLTIRTPTAIYARGLKTTAGTIEIFGNRLLEFMPPESDLRACTVIVQDNGQLRPGTSTPLLGNYIVNTTAADNLAAYHKLGCKVYGTFQPNTDFFCGCELQDGAVLDLSGRMTPLNEKSRIGDALPVVANTLSFAYNATILVNLAGREDLNALVKSDSPYLVTWETPPQNVTFDLDEETGRSYYARPDDTGLRLFHYEGTTIMLR
ncbi:MAG: hypothetical protein IJU44_08730 [Kiritimatiellae bacterium]|nr:hypothetical protein [Kiritimatiellia bacterium]